MKTAFETEPCTRCGGTGHYAFNGEHTRCYKCDGKNNGRAYTKRGKAAKDFYLASVEIDASKVKVGDVIRTLNFKRLPVFEIEKNASHPMIGNSAKTGFIFRDAVGNWEHVSVLAKVRLLPTMEQNEKLIADALAYQATLTKQGKPRK